MFRLILAFILALPLVATSAASSETGKAANPVKPTKPFTNVLFILTDNQTASLIGTYGNKDIKTPNIDQLASEGMKFNEAYAVNGMCSPTRATLMTGLMPSQHGVHDWLDDADLKKWPRDWSGVAEFRTLPYTLEQHGYQTAMIGKWNLGAPWEPSIGFQYWVTFPEGHTTDFWNNTIIDNGKIYQLKDVHLVDFFADRAVQYLDHVDKSKPFYLQLNFDGPYVDPPTNLGPARNKYYKEYLGKDLTSFPRTAIAKELIDQLVSLAAAGHKDSFVAKMIMMAMQMANDPETMANIASQNTVVDAAVGRVMAKLKELGLDRNTLVIFSTDQGNFYGQHGLWTQTDITEPTNLYDPALRIPLIFRQPGKIKPGRVSNALVSQYDFPETILQYAGLGKVNFAGSPGQSFADILEGRGNPDRFHQAVYFEQAETRGLRTADYAFWKRLDDVGPEMLFDMKNDPDQLHNLAGEKAYFQVTQDLNKKLDGFFNTYSTPAYDLWAGGTAKGSVIRPEIFRRIYGPDWMPVDKVMPAFKGP